MSRLPDFVRCIVRDCPEAREAPLIHFCAKHAPMARRDELLIVQTAVHLKRSSGVYREEEFIAPSAWP